MSIEGNVFKKCSPDYNKLEEYGFRKNKSSYTYEKLFNNGEFKIYLVISKNGKISGKVLDMENEDEYLPIRVQNQEGTFVAEIREEYLKILSDIKEKCFSENYFISEQANRITAQIIKKYGNKPEFMWEQAPDCGVFKNPQNNKWYGIIMNIPRSKLTGKDKTPVEIINIKLDRDEIQTLLKKEGFYPAWHMNKKTWITITLDETLHDDEIMKLLAESHSYTV